MDDLSPTSERRRCSVSHRHFKEDSWWLYANSKSCTKSFYLQNKLFMEAAFANYNFHSQILYFLLLIAVRIFNSSMTIGWHSQVKNKIPSPIIAACNTTWILVGSSSLFTLLFSSLIAYWDTLLYVSRVALIPK